MSARLVEEYDQRAPRIKQELDAIMAPLLEVSPDTQGSTSLAELGSLVASRAAADLPDLDPDVCQAIGNYYAYRWR